MPAMKCREIYSHMGGRITRWLNNPEKTLTTLNKDRAVLEKCKQIKDNSNLQEDETELQGGDPPDFPLLLRLSEWAALSSVPFSKLRKGLLKCSISLTAILWICRLSCQIWFPDGLEM